MKDKLYCLKMLARAEEQHLCGAERLCVFEEISKISQGLMGRVVEKGGNQLDSAEILLSTLDHFNFRSSSLPDFIYLEVKNYREGRNTARNLLSQGGVSEKAFNFAVNLLKKSSSLGGRSIPGAYLVDSFSGEILNPDMDEGLWIGRVDLADVIDEKLMAGLGKFGPARQKIRDNLVLATKMMGMPGFVGEINWSNNSLEKGGSITIPELGFAYFAYLRSAGNEVGGRVLFVRNWIDLNAVVEYMESEVLLIDKLGLIR
jgi:6-carboxyhexanoate--CoA ligase